MRNAVSLKTKLEPFLNTPAGLRLREVIYRAVCKHQQGDKPNIMLYCSRRGGSTWMLNTIAAHPGCRYVGRPFVTMLSTRHRKRLPDLNAAAGHPGESFEHEHMIHFTGEAEDHFQALAEDILYGRVEVYPALNFRAEYFHRATNRIVFQITNATPLVDWFDQRFDLTTVILIRHPVSTALSVMQKGWPHECEQFLRHGAFVERYLGDGLEAAAWDIVRSGDEMAQHVLDWSLKMAPLFRAFDDHGLERNWLMMTYEQTVLEPEGTVRLFSERLNLPEVEPMLEQVRRPSRSVTPTTAGKVADPSYLLGRWRERVDEGQERALMQIPERFGIDAYRAGELMPTERYAREQASLSETSVPG